MSENGQTQPENALDDRAVIASKGGLARAQALQPEKRSEIARVADPS
jgi:hypothetical protein